MSDLGLMLLICMVITIALNIYYVKPVWKKLKTKRCAHIRFAFWLIGTWGLNIYLAMECWRLVLKDLFI